MSSYFLAALAAAGLATASLPTAAETRSASALPTAHAGLVSAPGKVSTMAPSLPSRKARLAAHGDDGDNGGGGGGDALLIGGLAGLAFLGLGLGLGGGCSA